MEKNSRTIREVVKSVRDQGGEEVAVVRCTDGTYGVTRDGTLMETLRWEPDQLSECLEFLERFARTS